MKINKDDITGLLYTLLIMGFLLIALSKIVSCAENTPRVENITVERRTTNGLLFKQDPNNLGM